MFVLLSNYEVFTAYSTLCLILSLFLLIVQDFGASSQAGTKHKQSATARDLEAGFLGSLGLTGTWQLISKLKRLPSDKGL